MGRNQVPPRSEQPLLVGQPAPADLAARKARDEGELRRLAYVESLDPREREALDPR